MTLGLIEVHHGLKKRLCKASFSMIVPMKKKSVPKVRTLKKCNIFQHLNLEYTSQIPHRDLIYTPSKCYTGKP